MAGMSDNLIWGWREKDIVQYIEIIYVLLIINWLTEEVLNKFGTNN